MSHLAECGGAAVLACAGTPGGGVSFRISAWLLKGGGVALFALANVVLLAMALACPASPVHY